MTQDDHTRCPSTSPASMHTPLPSLRHALPSHLLLPLNQPVDLIIIAAIRPQPIIVSIVALLLAALPLFLTPLALGLSGSQVVEAVEEQIRLSDAHKGTTDQHWQHRGSKGSNTCAP